MPSTTNILIVEDNQIDVLLTSKLLKLIDKSVGVMHEENGKDALTYLEGNHQLINLIVLDLNMPVMNGIEFLRHRSNSDALNKIPVAVLTSSMDERDIENCEKLNAKVYLEKPITLEKARDILGLMAWIR